MMWMVVGVVVGWMAGIVLKDGGHGVAWDLVLALTGSGLTTSVLGITAGVEMPTLAVFAVVSAASVIGGQRRFWPAPPIVVPKVRAARRR